MLTETTTNPQPTLAPHGTMAITVIIPVHNERNSLKSLIDEIDEVLTAFGRTFEVIAVDDGSDDGSTELLDELTTTKPFLRTVFFRKNFGQASAFDAGFRHASGEIVITMDSDGQNDPHDIPRMIGILESGYDFVSGLRTDRQDNAIRRLPSRAANFIIRKVTGTQIHDLGCSLKAYRKDVVNELRLYGEMHRFIAVLVEGMGARTTETPVNHRARRHGKSKYGLSRTAKVLLDLVTVWFLQGYQTKPIYVFGGMGLVSLTMATAMAMYVLYEKFAWGIWVHRNPLFLLSMFLLIIAVQFVGMGIIAEIIVRTYFESQRKNSYTISTRKGFDRNL